mmetsp:Transcript_4727/g.10844  ORF Transcript_4727/g.10844 Transcript_4727/m.10844 type:complete len:220 (-) Transcript_4727:211-870(-)
MFLGGSFAVIFPLFVLGRFFRSIHYSRGKACLVKQEFQCELFQRGQWGDSSKPGSSCQGGGRGGGGTYSVPSTRDFMTAGFRVAVDAVSDVLLTRGLSDARPCVSKTRTWLSSQPTKRSESVGPLPKAIVRQSAALSERGTSSPVACCTISHTTMLFAHSHPPSPMHCFSRTCTPSSPAQDHILITPDWSAVANSRESCRHATALTLSRCSLSTTSPPK